MACGMHGIDSVVPAADTLRAGSTWLAANLRLHGCTPNVHLSPDVIVPNECGADTFSVLTCSSPLSVMSYMKKSTTAGNNTCTSKLTNQITLPHPKPNLNNATTPQTKYKQRYHTLNQMTHSTTGFGLFISGSFLQ